MDLVGAAKTINTIRQFMKEDLASLLARYDLVAAQNSLAQVDHAIDKRAVYWSTLNHLEAAEAKYEGQLKGSQRFQAAQALIYIASIRAIILTYLGEPHLVRGCLERSLLVVKTQNDNAWKTQSQIADVFAAWNPANMYGLWRYIRSPLGQAARSFKANDFWVTLGHPGPHMLDLDPGPDPDPNPYGD